MSDLTHLNKWLQLPNAAKLNVFQETGRKVGLPAVAIEKDWWMVHTLSLIFTMECAPALIFKGGTSLSKGWNLIERFSEDIDLALDKEYLGFTEEEPNKKAVNKLRRLSYDFISNQFTPELNAKFAEAGMTSVNVKYQQVINHDQDPLIVEIYYPKHTETDTYLKPGLLVEIGSRSLREPYTQRTFATIVADNYAGRTFADKPITVPVVNPERTFLEKIFLLHEEFQRPDKKKRVERLSRHLYDIEKLMDTHYAAEALQNKELYNAIVKNRNIFVKLGDVDYTKHSPENIKFIPPVELLPQWEADYKQMHENMIYGEAPPFADLIKKLTTLQTKINGIQWK
ncbi:MAG TPA: nucleotidyl transferase AbiEii/AbiGii toxin family protein [Bacteroidales bacterium]|nr:nucleotidyl transferase AbiEii/AbiGii toxin family protein [Bacteroidales bacterium]